MRIAFSALTDQGLESPISPHFGRCPFYVFVDLDGENQVIGVNAISNAHAKKHDPGQLPAYIRDQGADVMISGGMGGRAVNFFHQFNVTSKRHPAFLGFSTCGLNPGLPV